jgi:mono/diheme cytochrome c family protein
MMLEARSWINFSGMRKRTLAALAGALVLPSLALLLAWLGVFSFDATATPPAWERAIARMAFDASVARRAPPIANPIRATPDALLAGMKVFLDDCAGCHGSYGRNSGWGSEDFYPRVPQFARTPPRKPDWQLFWIVKHGVRYSGMGAWDRQVPDSTIWLLVTFLSHLDSLPRSVDAAWRKPGP